MYFHIIVSTECNSQCKYCYKKGFQDFDNSLNNKFDFDFDTPNDIEYDINELKAFLSRNKIGDESHVITFYGGEPLLRISKAVEVIDLLSDSNNDFRFMIQTNGLLLDKIPKDYLNKFSMILVSLDGDKQVTDYNRGLGTYDKVVSNVRMLRDNGFSGELVARMVVDEDNDVFLSVKHLLSLGLFDSVHWQLDAEFYEFDYKTREIKGWLKGYEVHLGKLIDWWFSEMESKGVVHKIYPLLGIFDTLRNNKKTKLRCGSGYANYTVSTNGKISVCPIMHDSRTYQVGDIRSSSTSDLKKVFVSGVCENCDVLDICGGRCLYSNKAEL